jgi:ATP-binding cassette, subfamily B, bacterial PglK
MIKNIKNLCEEKHYKLLISLFFGLIIATLFELIGLSSLPLFAMLILDSQVFFDNLPNFINKEILLIYTQKELALYGILILTFIFTIKNIYLGAIVYLQGLIIKNIRSSICKRLFNYYTEAPYSFHLQRNPAELLRNLTSDASKSTSVILATITFLKEGFILVMIFGLLFYTDPMVSFLVFLFLGIFVIIFFVLTKKQLFERGEKIQKFGGEQIRIVNQSFGAIKEIKILNKEKFVQHNHADKVENLEKNTLMNYFFTSIPRLFLEIITIFAIVLICTVFLYFNRELSSLIPIMTLLAASVVRLIPAFNSISTSLSLFKSLRPSLNLISQEIKFLEKHSSKILSNNLKKIELKDEIKFEDITFNFPSSNRSAVKDVNLNIKNGSKVGIIGKSGSGKSTFLDLFTGLLNPTKGKISVDGLDIKESIKSWQSQIAYVPQDIYLTDDTIKNNIVFGDDLKDIDQKRLDNAMLVAQVDEFMVDLPNGSETIVGNRGVRLSGGQRQRIGIARALYRDKEILFLDEATNSLDIENEKKILEKIFFSKKKKTLFIVSHRREALMNCDFILLFDNGKIIENDKYQEILKKHDFQVLQEEKK